MITDYLDGLKQTRPNHYVALCPVHGEKTASLSVTITDDGKTICHCFGCGANGLDVVDALGLTTSELFPDDGDFNREEYQHKKNIEFKKKQFMFDYGLVWLADLDMRRGKKLSEHDRKVVGAAVRRLDGYRFDVKEKFKELARQESMEQALIGAHARWQYKTLQEKYGEEAC